MGTLHSTREELRGIMAAEEIISKCGELWGSDITRSITFICDSKSALFEVDKPIEMFAKRDALGPEMDILMTIDTLKQKNENITRLYQWEKSHQDEDAPQTDSRRINEIADNLATECRKYVSEGLITADVKKYMPFAKVMVSVNGSRITKTLNVKYIK